MKKLICLSALIIFAATSFSQKKEKIEPKDVTEYTMLQFKNQCPDAKDVKWTRDENKKFEATFVKEDLKTTVKFSTNGDWAGNKLGYGN